MSSSNQRQTLLLELRRMQREVERDHRASSIELTRQRPLWRRCIRWLAPRS